MRTILIPQLLYNIIGLQTLNSHWPWTRRNLCVIFPLWVAHIATLCLPAWSLLLSSSLSSHAIHLWPETSWNCPVTTWPAERIRRRRSGMQSELQPWVHNTSGENMFRKKQKKEKNNAQKLDAVYILSSFTTALGIYLLTGVCDETHTLRYHFLSQSFTWTNSKRYKDTSASR